MQPAARDAEWAVIEKPGRWALSVCVGIILVLGIYPGPLLDWVPRRGDHLPIGLLDVSPVMARRRAPWYTLRKESDDLNRARYKYNAAHALDAVPVGSAGCDPGCDEPAQTPPPKARRRAGSASRKRSRS